MLGDSLAMADAPAGSEPTVALERLLIGDVSAEGASALVRRAGIPVDGDLFCTVIFAGGASPVDLARAVDSQARPLSASSCVCILNETVVLVAGCRELTDVQALRLVERLARDWPDISAGIGSHRSPADIEKSWRDALRTHALRSMMGSPRTAVAHDAALLLALADMPSSWVDRAGFHGANLRRVVGDVGSRDWDFLEAYLEERSLRKAAARVFLHHTSLDARLRRVSEELGVDLMDPGIQFELLLMMRVLRVESLLARLDSGVLSSWAS